MQSTPEPAARATHVAAALRHDDDAARALVRELYPLVARIVRAHRLPRTSEEDLCQMIFIRVFQKLSQFSGTVPLEHWVSRIAVNMCRNAAAAEKRRPELRRADLSEEQAAVIDNLNVATAETSAPERGPARELVETLLAMLQPTERLVIDLLYLQEKSVREIASLTGWSMPLVKVRAFRARQHLKQHLARLEPEERHGNA